MGSVLLAPWPGGERDTAQLIVRYQVARADGPGDWPFLWKGWPMFRHDLAHTGYNPAEPQLRPPLRLKWSYTTGSGIDSSPAVASGVVYVGTSDGKVYAFDVHVSLLTNKVYLPLVARAASGW